MARLKMIWIKLHVQNEYLKKLYILGEVVIFLQIFYHLAWNQIHGSVLTELLCTYGFVETILNHPQIVVFHFVNNH